MNSAQLKRYVPTCTMYEPTRHIGEWCKHSDVQALEERCKKLEKVKQAAEEYLIAEQDYKHEYSKNPPFGKEPETERDLRVVMEMKRGNLSRLVFETSLTQVSK